MQEDRFIRAKRAEGRQGEGGWRPGLGPLVGVVLAGVLLLAAVILGVTTGIGFLFAVPVGVVALVVALLMFRGKPARTETLCPNCNARVPVPGHIAEFDCPNCGGRLEVGGAGDVHRRAA